MVNLALGIDTGGTLTDGVLFDLDRKKIVAKTKVITTRHNLTLAVEPVSYTHLDVYKRQGPCCFG